MDNGFYVNGVNGVNELSRNCHSNDIREISFHIASNNGYFLQGINCNLHKLKRQHDHINFGFTFSNDSACSALLLTEMIRKKKRRTLMVVIANTALLNILSLSIEHHYRDRVIFIATNECRAELLTLIAESPQSTWAERDKYFPKEILSALSNRERHVCYYLLRGYTPKMIGMILGVNVKTVSSHRVSIMRKIGCTNKIGLYKTLRVYYGTSVEG
ncbi:TPA: LuxR C-terminal-related transcriptional regulator [Serratia fonticola]|uniref:helix-turn-helix transcriptional regulator n=1 Tax=Serratia fonticola TaxID=47917 RepID=UPI00137667E1|nr:LuxR C-terminal-related transcriptional regulator [Serratia fonticola]NBJ37183.1 hypothetical protein [Serratia fonticola]